MKLIDDDQNINKKIDKTIEMSLRRSSLPVHFPRLPSQDFDQSPVNKPFSPIALRHFSLISRHQREPDRFTIIFFFCCSLSECYFAGKGTALVLPDAEAHSKTSSGSGGQRTGGGGSSGGAQGSSNIQKHLQSMFYLLRPEETLKMVSKSLIGMLFRFSGGFWKISDSVGASLLKISGLGTVGLFNLIFPKL